MTNLWTVLYFTLGITLTGLMLVLFKRLFRDKLSARWHYLVWLVLVVRAILPENLRLFSTGFALNTLWVSDEASACGGGAGAKFAVIHAIRDGRRRNLPAEKNAVFRMVADG